ncbi:MAG: S1/P1 nuclease [Mucilaginibacter sp.]
MVADIAMESNRLATILYHHAEVNPDFGNFYYKENMPIVKNRIEKAGIRLAGVLNAIAIIQVIINPPFY